MSANTFARNQFLTSSDNPGLFGQILKKAQEASIAMSTMRVLTVPKDKTNIQLDDLEPTATWRNGDAGLSNVTRVKWKGKSLQVDDLDVLVAIEKSKLDDAEFDITAELMEKMPAAIARAIDTTVFLGGKKVISGFPTSAMLAGATAASNTVTRGTATAANGGLSRDLSDLFAKLESQGFAVGAMGASVQIRQFLRNARDTTGQLLADFNGGSYDGVPLRFGMRGLLGGSGKPELFAYDNEAFVVGVRQDMVMSRSDQAVITDENGNVLYNLFQQNMVAVKLSIRLGWQVGDYSTYNALGTNEKQTVTITGSPTGGTFTLSFGGLTTKPIAYNATAADVEAALQAIGTIGRDSVKVTLAGAVYTVEFVNDLGAQDVAQMTATASLTGGSSPNVAIATTVAGSSGTIYPAAVLLGA